MRLYKSKFFMRAMSLALAMSLITVDAAAVVKQVEVWGAQSINDQGQSDNRISMEELRDDYKDFEQTDGLREYFHRDQDDPYKVDLSEALSWLIDNEVISRDQNVTVSNIRSNRVPSVSISKFDAEGLGGKYVNRSDLIMYLYKAVYGPIDARTVGVETPNIRVDNGYKDTLWQIMRDNKYLQTIQNDSITGVTQKGSTPGGATGGTEIITIGGHYDYGGSGSGATGGSQQIQLQLSPSSAWRYTPQGDEYDSIFGDTNIFVSDVNIEQSADNSSKNTSGSHGGGGQGGNAGNNQSIIYETDYKQIYYVPGADLMFYRTNDVVEVYLRAALSKGILDDESSLRTQLFKDTFMNSPNTTASLPCWSPSAPAYIVNRSSNKQTFASNVQSAKMADILGANYSISFSNGTFNVNRVNLFQSNTGYFTTERIFKMDIYRYIYRFIYANEKKLSNLETDIINYKYGMELDGVAEESDIAILKYLIAMGILNFDETADFNSLYEPITYADFLPILYRVANRDARLDFSKVQLTDSEQQWQARGYAPQTLYVVSGDVVSDIQLEFKDSYVTETTGPNDTETVTETLTHNDARPLDFVTTETQANGTEKVMLGDPTVADLSTVGKPTSTLVNGFSFNFTGVAIDNNKTSYYAPTVLKNYLKEISQSLVSEMECSYQKYSNTNPKHDCMRNFCDNLFVIATLRSYPSLYNECIKVIDTEVANLEKGTQATVLNKADAAYKAALLEVKGRLDTNVNGTNAPQNIKFITQDQNKSEVFSNPIAMGNDNSARVKKAGSYLQAIEFNYSDSAGNAQIYSITREPRLGSVLEGVSSWLNFNEVSGTVSEMIGQANKQSYKYSLGVSEADLNMLGRDGVVAKFGAQITSSDVKNAATEGACIMQFADPNGKDAFVSWSAIEQYNNSCVNEADQIPIVKVSDLILYNTATDTYAYFSTEGAKKIALVGTAVVSGDDDLGVAFSAGEGEAAVTYYHINALRLLMNAKQETAVLSGVRNISLASTAMQNNLSTIRLESESGHSEGGLVGIKAMISENDTQDKAGLPADSPYFSQTATYNTRWANFISLSQANRAVNVISRRITYTKTELKRPGTIYAVVTFEPVDMGDIGTTSVNKSTSLQDLLDAPAQVPETEAGKAVWEANKKACNAYANWVYGTANKTYIETGYLKPTAYLYSADTDVMSQLPASVFKPLTEAQRTAIKIVGLKYIPTGAVCKIGTSTSPLRPQEAMKDERYASTYYVSNDYRVMIAGDRVYLHEQCFPNLSHYVTRDGQYVFRNTNSNAQKTAFIPGSTFKMQNHTSTTLPNGMVTPTVMVTGISSDGIVTCQVGPVIGLPISLGGSSAIVDYSKCKTSVLTVAGYNFTDRNTNLLLYAKDQMLSGYAGITYGGIIAEPSLAVGTKTRSYVYTGSKLNIYTDQKIKPVASVSTPAYNQSKTIKEIYNSTMDAVAKYSTESVEKAETYFKISFSAYDYTVKNGVLLRSSATASDFLSPSLFTSLNDMIIDEMMNKSNGAIPINEIPNGSLLKVGTGYYCAMGSSAEDKSFVGYAFLDQSMSGVYLPKIQDVSRSFANHFIRGGNQYINVSHYFKSLEVLGGTDAAQKNALSVVATNTMVDDGKFKYAVNANGSVTSIVNGTTESEGYKYAPCKIVFQNELLAYPSSSPGAAVVTYTIASNADNSVAGPLSDLPFFTDSVLDATLLDQTTQVLSAGFAKFEGSNALLNALKEQFEDAFAGDLFTLVRMIMFIILVWLVVASWICYGFYVGNLMPILDAIKHPTANGGGKGIDLFKVISLGTISIDTDFKLGRFLQYNAVIAILICVVWKSGAITF